MKNLDLSPEYKNSHALIIGINQYKIASPLKYAKSDAEAIAKILVNKFGFNNDNIRILLDDRATRHSIMGSFLSFANPRIDQNDRLLIFYAGHGHTITGNRGEVGFLIPFDGDPNDLSTLIRWDELTRNTELIPAKHILFIMDACYGGLAVTRALPVGSMRFLKDMLLRYARQVVTAGKADEVVADSGGPIPEHSVFTGHLLQALDGKASTADGVITANGLMAYVYERVGKDHNSYQTPHYGYLDGDGDFIFHAPNLIELAKEEKMDEDVLISIPSFEEISTTATKHNIIELSKEYLSDDRFTIKLHDLVVQKIREVLNFTSDDNFIVPGTPFSVDELKNRLNHYEVSVFDLLTIVTCVSYWGGIKHYPILKKAVSRVTDRIDPQGGLVIWNSLRWYPVILLLYCAGIAALSSEKYDNLFILFSANVGESRTRGDSSELILAIGDAIAELERTDAFKKLPGHERNYVARSEYIFKLLQPWLDDILFLGREYEEMFDRFEIFLALVYADYYYDTSKQFSRIWGPIGRFGWKYHSRRGKENIFKIIADEAQRSGKNWPPLNAGFFQGSIDRFIEISEKYEEILQKLNWF